jgi:hypothetical protein
MVPGGNPGMPPPGGNQPFNPGNPVVNPNPPADNPVPPVFNPDPGNMPPNNRPAFDGPPGRMPANMPVNDPPPSRGASRLIVILVLAALAGFLGLAVVGVGVIFFVCMKGKR